MVNYKVCWGFDNGEIFFRNVKFILFLVLIFKDLFDNVVKFDLIGYCLVVWVVVFFGFMVKV